MTPFMQRLQKSSVNKYVVLGLRILIGGIFLAAGLIKTIQPLVEFIAVAKTWNILPDPWVTIYAWLLPWVEVVFGATFLFGAWQRVSSAMIGLMLLSFLIAIAINIGRGTALSDCGCFGELFKFGETFWDLWWRDLGLFIGTLWVMMMPKPLWFSIDAWLKPSPVA